MPELIWDGKYDEHGRRPAPLRVALPFQTVETVNESVQQRQQTLDLFAGGKSAEWRNRLIWGDNKYVLPALLDEFAGSFDLIYIDPPFATGQDFSFRAGVENDEFIKQPSLIEQKLGNKQLYLLLDEWTAVPEELQPLLAEFLKRALFVLPSVTVKIAALEYRSSFAEARSHNNVIGFEVGADISSSLELDDYFVYDRNTAKTEDVFAEVLYRHLAAEMLGLHEEPLREEPTGHLEREFAVADSKRLVEFLFAGARPYRELVRAGEGVLRDFIGVFAAAFFDAVRRDQRAVDLVAVRTAARNWFASDKEVNVRRAHRDALDQICEEVIAKGRRRTFLVDRRHEPIEALQALVDRRVLHVVARNVLDPQLPTRRYSLYSLDYGLYVDLLDSRYALKPEFGRRGKSGASGATTDVIPLNNRAYFRGLVLDPELIERSG